MLWVGLSPTMVPGRATKCLRERTRCPPVTPPFRFWPSKTSLTRRCGGADASVESAGSEPRSPPASPTIDPFSVGAAELSLGSGVQTPLSAFTLVSRLLLSHAEVATKSSANTPDAPRDVVRLTNGIWRVARASSLCGWRVTRRPLGGNPRAWTLPTRRTTPSERPCQLEVGTSGLRP